MNDVADVQFTISQAVEAFIWICGTIVAVSAAANVIFKIRDHFKKPGLSQDAAIAEARAMIADTNRQLDAFKEEVNDKFADYDRYFKNDKIKIESIEEGNRYMQKAMLALLSHNLDGNHTDQMEKARDELHDYLIDK